MPLHNWVWFGRRPVSIRSKDPIRVFPSPVSNSNSMDGFVEVAATEVVRKYFHQPFDILDKDSLSALQVHISSMGRPKRLFIHVRNKVKVPLYGCDCYPYALLASGIVDLVI